MPGQRGQIFSVCTLFKSPCVQCCFDSQSFTRVLQYPLLAPPSWVVLAVHLPSLVGVFSTLNPKGVSLQAVTFGACLYLRGAFASDCLYTQHVRAAGIIPPHTMRNSHGVFRILRGSCAFACWVFLNTRMRQKNSSCRRQCGFSCLSEEGPRTASPLEIVQHVGATTKTRMRSVDGDEWC